MSFIESIAALSTLVFGISLLFIIRAVRRNHYEFVSSAVEGWPWLGFGRVRIRFFLDLYGLYFNARGCDFWLILNLASFIVMLSLALFMLIWE